MKKFIDVLGSRNAFVSILSIILLFLSYNNIIINQTPEELIDMFSHKGVNEIVSIILMNFMNPLTKLTKLIASKQFNWDWLYSTNFQTQVITVVSLCLGAYFGDETAALVMSIGVQIMNFVTHLFKPTKAVSE